MLTKEELNWCLDNQNIIKYLFKNFKSLDSISEYNNLIIKRYKEELQIDAERNKINRATIKNNPSLYIAKKTKTNNWFKKQVDDLTDYYIRKLLRNEGYFNITQDIIQSKRLSLEDKRKLII